MKEILEKLYCQNGFTKVESQERTLVFENENVEYYIIETYKNSEILSFFKEDEKEGKTDGIFKVFDNLKKQKEDIAKNTTLIIGLEIDKLRDIEKYKNIIFKIEEDEYFFKKNVVVYTNEAIEWLENSNNISGDVIDKIKEDGKLDNYMNSPYSDKEFFVSLQLAVKLPFITLRSEKTQEFEPIDKLLTEKINEKKLNEAEEQVKKYFEEIDIDEEKCKLEKMFLTEEDNDEIEEFYSKFTSIFEES